MLRWSGCRMSLMLQSTSMWPSTTTCTGASTTRSRISTGRDVVVRRGRLDAELVRRGLARSREEASSLVTAGRVRIEGTVASKAATNVSADASIVVVTGQDGPRYVSRGGYKLAGALDSFQPAGLQVEGRRCLDAGASTGGFTDVLLRRGATSVVAVDVGYGQLAWSLRTDPRVEVVDRTNVRDLTPELVGGRVDLLVADLSFISLGLVLPALHGCVTDDGDLVLMVKPQFEVGRGRLGPGGVVRDPAARRDAVGEVARRAWALGLGVQAVVASPLPGPSGNVEYFLWLRARPTALEGTALDAAVKRAVEEGPQ
jgi:23S rRNA (cytidine1920-2'-O)/16S rRNA (cytidine1409-2'-O)-methyltransferase